MADFYHGLKFRPWGFFMRHSRERETFSEKKKIKLDFLQVFVNGGYSTSMHWKKASGDSVIVSPFRPGVPPPPPRALDTL